MSFEQLKWVYRAWRYRQWLERQEIRLLLRQMAPADVAVGGQGYVNNFLFLPTAAIRPGAAA
jgi:hypothetical protein